MELLQLAPETLNYHCPFNPSHTMPYKTLIKHLIRCPDKLPNHRSCIYNISHVMPESELQEHEEHCPNRILFDTAVYESEDMIRPVPIVNNMPKIEYDETWDGLEQTTDVLKSIGKKTILMKAKHNETKSERKKHRVSLHEHDTQNDNKLKQGKSKHGKKSEKFDMKGKIEQLNCEANTLFIGQRPNI